MLIEGPYGTALDYSRYSHILLIASGVGIAPCHSILRTLYLLAQQNMSDCSAKLVWASRSLELFRMMEDSLQAIHQDSIDQRFACELFYTKTRTMQDAALQTPIPVTDGRPLLQSHIEAVPVYGQGGLVFVSASPEMVAHCRQLCDELGVEMIVSSLG